MNQEEASLRLKVWSTILLEGCWYLSSTTNQITLLPFVYLKQHVDWLELFMAQSEAPCFFPIYGARNVYKHWCVFECTHWMDSCMTVRSSLLNLMKTKCTELASRTLPFKLFCVHRHGHVSVLCKWLWSVLLVLAESQELCWDKIVY